MSRPAGEKRPRRPRPGRDPLPDLTPYTGCPADDEIGLAPLAVGWLQHGQEYPQGRPPAGFATALLPFCLDAYRVCPLPSPQPCPLCQQAVPVINHHGQPATLGSGELRVIGEEEIYAAPTLLYHYVTAHQYLPPEEFVAAVLSGPPAGSAEHRALIRTLQSYR